MRNVKTIMRKQNMAFKFTPTLKDTVVLAFSLRKSNQNKNNFFRRRPGGGVDVCIKSCRLQRQY